VTNSDMVLIWITEGTWRAAVDAALRLAPAGTPITLLYVAPAELPEAAHGAYLGRLGRPCDRVERQGAAEREVVTAAAGAGLLVWSGAAPDIATIPPPPPGPG
jgi:hypothetical protein